LISFTDSNLSVVSGIAVTEMDVSNAVNTANPSPKVVTCILAPESV
jgi:hypothetical protein